MKKMKIDENSPLLESLLFQKLFQQIPLIIFQFLIIVLYLPNINARPTIISQYKPYARKTMPDLSHPQRHIHLRVTPQHLLNISATLNSVRQSQNLFEVFHMSQVKVNAIITGRKIGRSTPWTSSKIPSRSAGFTFANL